MATKGFSSVVARLVAGEGRLGFFGVKGFRGLTRCFLAWAVVMLLAQASWAQRTINVANAATQTGVTVSNNDITVTATNSTLGYVITGSAAGKRLMLNAGTTTDTLRVTFRNLTITGDVYSAVLIGTSNVVKITLEGNNLLTGGIGSAGLRVPSAANLTIAGTGTLTAIGGQYRSLIQADAGAGIGGGIVPNTSSSNTANLTDNCGAVTINSGTIYAYGGGSGEDGTGNNGRYTAGAGIGGSGYLGGGCNLTINGGNIVAVGGNPTANDIGPGIRYNAANFTSATVTDRGASGTTRIYGGSVNASVYYIGATTPASITNATTTSEITPNTLTQSITNATVTYTLASTATSFSTITASAANGIATTTTSNTCNANNCPTGTGTLTGSRCRGSTSTGTANVVTLDSDTPRARCNATSGTCYFIYTFANGQQTTSTSVGSGTCIQFNPTGGTVPAITASNTTGIVTGQTNGVTAAGVVQKACNTTCTTADGCVTGTAATTALGTNTPRGRCNITSGTCSFTYTAANGATSTIDNVPRYSCVYFTPTVGELPAITASNTTGIVTGQTNGVTAAGVVQKACNTTCTTADGCVTGTAATTALGTNTPRGRCNITSGTCSFTYTAANGATSTINNVPRYSCVYFTPTMGALDAIPATATSGITVTTPDATNCTIDNCTEARGCVTSTTATRELTANQPRGRCNVASGTCSFTYTATDGNTSIVSNVPRYQCAYFTPSLGTSAVIGGNGPAVRYTFKVGTSTDTQDKSVSKCQFGSISCDKNVPPSGVNKYGINDVRTDIDNQVYFWLPSTYTTSTTPGIMYGGSNNIYLDGVPTFADPNVNAERYHFLNTLDATTRVGQYRSGDAVPEMDVPTTMANTKVGAFYPSPIGIITGPYRTDSLYALSATDEVIKTKTESSLFTTVGIEHVSAVGKPLAIIKGAFKKKSDYGEGTHTVQWYRAAANSTCITALRIYDRTKAGCDAISIPGSGGELSSSAPETHYKPVAADYGKFIWAEVTVKDNRGSEAGWNTVLYPVVKIGVVINAVPKLSKNFVNTGLEPQTMLTVGPGIPMSENLFLPYELMTFDIKTVTATAILEDEANKERELSYKWSLSVPPVTQATEIGAGNPFVYTVPSGDNAPSNDITLYVEIIDGSNQKLDRIDFCSNLFDGSNFGTCSGTTTVGSQVNAQNIAVNLPSIPKSGQVKLKFKSPLGATMGSVSLNGVLTCSAPEGLPNNEWLCNYSGLTAGTTYTLAVQGFQTIDQLVMNRFTADAKVEKKADIVWSNDNDGFTAAFDNYTHRDMKLTPGKNARGVFKYDDKTDAGPMTALYWYFEVSADRTFGTDTYTASDKPFEGDAEIKYNYSSANIIDKGCRGGTGCAAIGALDLENIDIAAATLLPAHFTKWVRLVVRVDGANPVEGDPEGKPFFGPWVQVGVLLSPAITSGANIVPVASTDDGTLVPGCFGYGGKANDNASSTNTTNQDQCRTFSAVNIGACDPTSEASIRNNPNCTKEGLYVYDFNPYMLSAPARALWLNKTDDKRMNYKLLDWTDDAVDASAQPKPNKCPTAAVPTSAFDCETFHQYVVPTNPKGKYTIRPIMGEWTRPAIAEATIYGGVKSTDSPNYGTTVVPLKVLNDGNKEGENVSIYDNIIVVNFGSGNNVSGDAQEIVVINTTDDNTSVGDFTCEFAALATSGTACTITLPTLAFDKGYRVEIRGFKSTANDETMDTEVFSFRTGLAPSFSAPRIRNTSDDWYANLEPNKGSEKFAVGKAVTIKPVSGAAVKYEKHGGGTLSSWTICLETSGGVTADCSTTGVDETSFNIAIEELEKALSYIHYGKNVQFTISGKYKVNTSAEYDVTTVATASVPVGVVVSVDPAGLDKTPSTGASAGALGALSYRVENSTITTRIVYETKVPLRIVSDVGTDKLQGTWSATGGTGTFEPANETITEWTPSNIEGDITFKASMTDGRPLNISAALNDATTSLATGFVFTFNPSDSRTISKGTGKITINGTYVCDVLDLEADRSTSISGATAAVPFACFINDDEEPFTVANAGSINYVLSIEAGVFKDARNNSNTANPTLYNFNSTGSTFVAELSGGKTSIMKDKIYDGTATFVDENGQIVLENVGTGTIKVDHYCMIAVGLSDEDEKNKVNDCTENPATHRTHDEINVNATNAGNNLSKGGTATFTLTLVSSDVKVDANGYAVPYRANLIIKVNNGQTFKVPVSYTINKAPITLKKYAQTLEAKPYDGTPLSLVLTPGPETFSWTSTPPVTGLTVSLYNSSTGAPLTATFDTEHTGSKQIAIIYKLTATGTNPAKASNYAFASNGRDEESSVITSSITKRDVHISLTGYEEGKSYTLGVKDYNGSSELEEDFYKMPSLSYIAPSDEGNADRLQINTAVYLDAANAGNRKIQTFSVHLTGTHANNYNLAPVAINDFSATIAPRALHTLAANGNNNYGSNCVVLDAVEHGTKISDLTTLQGRTALTGGSNCPVVDETAGGTKQTVIGNWTVCTEEDHAGDCASLYTNFSVPMPSKDDDVGPVGTSKILYAFYKVESTGATNVANFMNDLVVKVNLTVKPLPVLSIAANLSKVNEGVKKYDGDEFLDETLITPTPDDNYKELLKCLEADYAKFTDNSSCAAKDACSGKIIEVKWKGKEDTEALKCSGTLSNYDLAKLLPSKIAGGIIQKQKVEVICGEDAVKNKDYDGSPLVLEFDKDQCSINKTASNSAVLTAEDVALVIAVTPRASFVTSNVNIDANGEPSEIAVNLNPLDFSLNGTASKGYLVDNYELELNSAAQAKIRPIDLAGTATTTTAGGPVSSPLDLRQRSSYNSNLSDIRIVTAGTMRWPSNLDGISSSSSFAQVSGTWEWVNGETTKVGNATVGEETEFKCSDPIVPSDDPEIIPNTSGEGNIYKNKVVAAAIFKPYSPNYKELKVDVNLCVEPYKIIAGPPTIAGYGVKTYDATNAYPHKVETSDAWRSWNKTVNDINIPEGYAVAIAAALYEDEGGNASSTNSDYKPLRVTYKVEGCPEEGLCNFLKPDDFIYPAGIINKRLVTIDGFVAEDKFYDGTPNALVHHIGAKLTQAKDYEGDVGILETHNTLYLVAPEGVTDWNLYAFSTSAASEVQQRAVCDESEKVNEVCPDLVIKRELIPLDLVRGYGIGPIDHPAYKNYLFTLPNLEAKIFRASFVNYMCNEIDLELKDGEVCDEKLLHDIVTARVDKAVQAQYGDFFHEFANKIQDVMPSTLKDLFGVEDNTVGSWSWISCTDEESCKHTYTDQIWRMDAGWGYAQYLHGSGNYEVLPKIPVPIEVSPRQLYSSQVYATQREYLWDPDRGIKLTPGSVPSKSVDIEAKIDNIRAEKNELTIRDNIAIKAIVEFPDAGEKKPIMVVFSWANIYPENKFYVLPPHINPGFEESSDLPMVNITTSECTPPAASAVPDPSIPSPFVWDRSNLDELIKFPIASYWSWENPGAQLVNPAANGDDVYETSQPAQYRDYSLCPFPNYHPAVDTVSFLVHRRSLDDGIKSAIAEAGAKTCGSSTALVTIVPNDQHATIWHNDEQRAGIFNVSDRPYGIWDIPFQIKAQDYDKDAANYSVAYNRLLPFDKVVYMIREKTMTIAVDSVQNPVEYEYYNSMNIDPNKTMWYKGNANPPLHVSTGRNQQGDGNDFWVMLYDKDGNYVTSSCFRDGTTPEYTVPIAPKPVTLIASSFSSKVVAGGTTLTLNTPNGGNIKIYTMKGQLVTTVTAVENRTVVRVPKIQGMYIVKLEAK